MTSTCLLAHEEFHEFAMEVGC